MSKKSEEQLGGAWKEKLSPHKNAEKEWFLSLLDDEKQRAYEEEHISLVMRLLRAVYIRSLQDKIKNLEEEKKKTLSSSAFSAHDYVDVVLFDKQIAMLNKKIDTYKCFFEEPYFARMDLVDDKEGYNSYYIGKRGDEKLEIVDWRAPLAKRYYQKSKLYFSINEYHYKTILRRAIQTKNGKVLDFKNEYLSVKDYLSKEEIAGRDEELSFDPYLRRILKERKDESSIQDIIETIQEKQYELITEGEKENFIVQGCAGSGKTMVLLHRLSYLLYNNEELSTRDVLVITPSNSFNDFIDELATVLELEKVRTMTIQDYFLEILDKMGVPVSKKINPEIVETKEYLSYLYSPAFPRDVEKTLFKIYDSLHGLLSSKESEEIVSVILEKCARQGENYTSLRNASQRVRRAIFGELKEKEDGGVYYTRSFRAFMNAISSIEEFLGKTVHSEKSQNAGYFYRQIVEFYQNATFVVRHSSAVVSRAKEDLTSLRAAAEKEIQDYKRYLYRVGSHEYFTYPDAIALREKLVKEIEGVLPKIDEIGDDCLIFKDFYEVLRGEKNFAAIGKCENLLSLVRLFYKDTIKKAKNKYGVTGKGLVPSDAFAICLLLSRVGERMPLRHSLVFVDEGQDISENEYDLLRRINPSAAFNVFGDLQQNVTPYRGIQSWEKSFSYPVHELKQNYRNTNQIVKFVASALNVDMQAIGFDGPEIQTMKAAHLTTFFKGITGLKAVIASENNLLKYDKKGYNLLRRTGKISKQKINVMTVYESKGLEFSAVAVEDKDLSPNEKYIAYTRALMTLVLIGD